MKIKSLDTWIEGGNNNFIIISGPCGAETRSQILNTADQISQVKGVHLFRAGVWKPRTRPGGFEGVGKKALSWLKEAKEKYGLKVAVEVARSQHVEECLKAGIDVLWIGARTTSNPFSVQEVADALQGVDIPVLIKNPLNPDLNLWIGAIERVYRTGNNKIAAVHRGFFPFRKTRFRNDPKWEIVIELKSRFHNLPIICDPSHITGDSRLLNEISQKSLDLNMNGLMIESHCTPELALCDGKQQITPTQLGTLLLNLTHRVETAHDTNFKELLGQYRIQIDEIDTQVIKLFAQRRELALKIGKEKQKRNVSILQLKRWKKMRQSRLELAREFGLSEKFMDKILQLIHKESISIQSPN